MKRLNKKGVGGFELIFFGALISIATFGTMSHIKHSHERVDTEITGNAGNFVGGYYR